MSAVRQSDQDNSASFRAVLASGLVCFCAGALYGWSALIAPLQTSFDVSTAQTGLVFSLAIVSFTLAVIVTPLLPFGSANPKVVAGFGIIGSICLVAATYATTYPLFLLFFSGGFGAASGGVYIAALGVAGVARRHTVTTPAMVAAFGLGGAVFGPIWRQMDAAGWGLTALIPLAALLCSAALISALAGNGTVRSIHASPLKTNKSDVQTMRLIWILFALGSFGGLMVLGLGAKMMEAADVGVGLASVGLAGIALGNTGGRLSVMWLSGRLRPDQILLCAMGLTLIGLTTALIQSSAAVVCLGLALVAIGYGMVASSVPVLTREVFDTGQFQRRFALIFTAWGAAGFLAPWVGGALYDWAQSFTPPLLCAVLAAVLVCVISPRLRRRF